MFNVSKIQSGLYGLVGFRQPFNPSYQKLSGTNLLSRSGYFVTDNPFAKVENLFESQDYAGISDANFNLLLERKQKESIASVCNAVFNEPDFIDRQVLYANPINKVGTENLPVGFVGYKIKVENKKNIAFSIKRVLLDFSGTGSFDLLLFNTSSPDPIETKTITITGPSQEEKLDWYIDNSDGYYKGEFYLGYINDGLTVVPYKRDYELSNLMSLITHLCVEPIKVPGHIASTLFDLTSQEGLSENTGVNPDITVYKDYTDLIINNELLFANAINLDLTISCLTESLASLRSNRTERNSEYKIIRLTQEIEGQESGEGVVKVTGLRPQLYRQISLIRTEIKKLQSGYFGNGVFNETLN